MSNIKRNAIPISVKLQILKDLEENISSKEIFKRYGINKSHLYKIKQTKDKLKGLSTNPNYFKKGVIKLRQGDFPDLEAKLNEWFLSELANENAVTNENLKSKALEIHKELNIAKTFTASSGFLDRFKRRHGIEHDKGNKSLILCPSQEEVKNDMDENNIELDSSMIHNEIMDFAQSLIDSFPSPPKENEENNEEKVEENKGQQTKSKAENNENKKQQTESKIENNEIKTTNIIRKNTIIKQEFNFEDLMDSFNHIIRWAEHEKLSDEEISFLKKIRNNEILKRLQ